MIVRVYECVCAHVWADSTASKWADTDDTKLVESDIDNEWPDVHPLHKVEMRTWLSDNFGDILCHSSSC